MGLPIFESSKSAQDGGAATSVDTTEYRPQAGDATGAGVDTGAGSTRPKTEAEIEADRLYEEAMEEQYAMREGGA